MFDNIDELIEVNLKLLFASKSQFMMRINFKDEYGFNLKNSKVFAEILEHKGLIVVEKKQGFRCDLTDVGRHIYSNGGWIKYKRAVDSLSQLKEIPTIDSQVQKIKKSFYKKMMIVGVIVLLLSFFITLLTLEFFKS